MKELRKYWQKIQVCFQILTIRLRQLELYIPAQVQVLHIQQQSYQTVNIIFSQLQMIKLYVQKMAAVIR